MPNRNGHPTINDVANWFLREEAISPKRLQKLVYYVQAWSYALFNEPLIFNEDDEPAEFQAWQHGPVNPGLYEQYRSFRWKPIEIDPNEIEDEVQYNQLQQDLLESVWETYKDYSPNEIENLTHSEGPWINARRRAGAQDGESSTEVITAKDMKEYYSSIYIGD